VTPGHSGGDENFRFRCREIFVTKIRNFRKGFAEILQKPGAEKTLTQNLSIKILLLQIYWHKAAVYNILKISNIA
jgi:hypothetical protein